MQTGRAGPFKVARFGPESNHKSAAVAHGRTKLELPSEPHKSRNSKIRNSQRTTKLPVNPYLVIFREAPLLVMELRN